jgi:hypothetical protein
VLLPHGVNHRYDLVLDQGDEFLRVQCKTESVYMVPSAGIARGYCALRVDPCANGQIKHVNWASEHELPTLERPEPERGIEPLAPELQVPCSTN